MVSFRGSLPVTSLAVFGLLALVGARILVNGHIPLLLDLLLVSLAGLYQGFHAGQILRADSVLPVANAAGLGVIVVGVFFVCSRFVSAMGSHEIPSLRVPGFVVLALAGLWQLAEYADWVRGPVASDLAMGLARLPLLSVLFLVAAWLAWPRRRRFATDEITKKQSIHWLLLGLSFFLLPLGTLRLDIPFYSPDAPSAAEASRVMSTLLSDTYLAFNLADEDAAFDRLARNLSQDLVADVYLDSRRRLRAGTREGAEVRVRDVSVVEVDEAIATAGKAFTYPCQWVVTARVRHLQHIHNRQNVYVGELTLQIEDDGWKIGGLNLLSEERVILSWAQS
jgi:hypothetical protein